MISFIYLLLFDIDSASKLKDIEEDVFELFNQGEWALSPISSSQLLGIRNRSGNSYQLMILNLFS
jgi:hypothetical protein